MEMEVAHAVAGKNISILSLYIILWCLTSDISLPMKVKKSNMSSKNQKML